MSRTGAQGAHPRDGPGLSALQDVRFLFFRGP